MVVRIEAARAKAADSATRTEEARCINALMKILIGGDTSVLTMKTPNPAFLWSTPSWSRGSDALE
jgi:hypothetical protein